MILVSSAPFQKDFRVHSKWIFGFLCPHRNAPGSEFFEGANHDAP